MKRLIKLKSLQGHKDGPAISGLDGKILGSDVLDDAFHEVLLELFQTKRGLFLERLRLRKRSNRPIRCSELCAGHQTQ